jgi:hypothetical protein
MFYDPDILRAARNLIAAHGKAAAAVAQRRCAAMEDVGLRDVARHWRSIAELIEQLQPADSP